MLDHVLIVAALAAISGAALVGLFFARAAWRLMFVKSAQTHAVADLSGDIGRVIRGEVPVTREGRRDYRVSGGMAFDKKSRKIKEQDFVSDEVIDYLL